jgi:hypothetical protein
MTHLPDEDGRLTTLLRAIATPEPPPGFLGGARRRYVQALEARYRREVFTGLVASTLGLVLAATLLLSVFEPVALIARIAVAAAEVMAWMKGVAIVLSIVPPVLWASALLGLVVSLLPFVLFARTGSTVVVK